MRLFLFLLLSVCAWGREVEVQNFARGPLCLSSGVAYYDLPAGVSRLRLEDGLVVLSTSNGMATAEIAGGLQDGLRLVVFQADGVPVVAAESYKLGGWYFGLGVSFMLPIVGFGLYFRVVKQVVKPAAENL